MNLGDKKDKNSHNSHLRQKKQVIWRHKGGSTRRDDKKLQVVTKKGTEACFNTSCLFSWEDQHNSARKPHQRFTTVEKQKNKASRCRVTMKMAADMEGTRARCRNCINLRASGRNNHAKASLHDRWRFKSLCAEQTGRRARLHSPQHSNTSNAAFIEAIAVLMSPRDVQMGSCDSGFSLRALLLVQRQP